jgi:starch-binding outer membrane protein, SusD/RagB family
MLGTVLVPGQNLGSQAVQLQAGVYVWNEAANRYDRFAGSAGSLYDDGLPLTGTDGPFFDAANRSGSGLYIKKYLNPNPSSGRYSPGDDTWWIFFRLGETYMNAAEAAFQLGHTGEALGYINTLRERAGFPPNSLNSLTMEKIQSERWAELAYEDHRLWDLRRWRIAHEVWDGNPSTDSASLWVLFPYRIVRPGHEHHNKYVFDRFITPINTSPRHFRVGNYYSQIPGGAINNNPLLVQNPIQE